MTTKYRVTMTSHGKRIATSQTWDHISGAKNFADGTNHYYVKANARVVKDSERVRRMIP